MLLKSDSRLLNALNGMAADRVVAYAVLTNVASLIAGPITVLLIARYFSPELQGYYYTFGSLLTLQYAMEFGMGQALIQFASHEWVGLSFDHAGRIVGDAKAYIHLLGLGHLAIKWYTAVAILVVFVLGPAGYLFFITSETGAQISWLLPWLTTCILLGLYLIITPFFVLLQGCHEMRAYWFYRLIHQTIDGIVSVIAILLGFGLWSIPLAAACRLIWSVLFLLARYRGFIASFLVRTIEKSISWRREVWPIQWRIAIAWFSAYFTTQLFVPILFRRSGPVAAGQMGMTITLSNVIIAIASTWVVTKVPRFGGLIARRNYDELDALFKRSFATSIAVAGLSIALSWMALVLMGILGTQLATRVLPPGPAGLILLSGLFATTTTGLSVYLRAHKKEPLVWVYFLSTVLTSFLAFQLGNQWGALGIAAGYLLVLTVFQLPASVMIFSRSRRDWHQLAV